MKKLILLCVTLLVAVGCQEAKIDAKPEPEPAPTPELEVEVSELNLDYKAQEVVIALRTNQTIEAEVAMV